MSAGPNSYCPNCGAVNPPDAERCVSCHRVLPGREGRDAPSDSNATAIPLPGASPTSAGSVSWADPFAGTPGSGGFTDPGGYPEYDHTSAGYQTGAGGFPTSDPRPAAGSGYAAAPFGAANTYGAGARDGYAYGTGPSGHTEPYDASPPPSGQDRIVSPRQPLPPPVRRQGGGRGGCLMGCLAFLIIGLVAAALVGLAVVRPFLQDEVGGELERVVATQIVRQLAPGAGTPELTAGTYTISAEEINAELRRNADDYEPLEDLRITIDPAGLELGFDAYGRESSYRGGVAVADGRLVLTDIDASGIAERVLPAEDVQEIIERELNDYVAGAGLVVTDVELGDGTLTLTTAAENARAATPNAATPAVTTPAPRAAAPTGAATARIIAPPPTATQTPEDTAAVAEPTSPLTAFPRPNFPRPTPTPDGNAGASDDTPAGDGTGL